MIVLMFIFCRQDPINNPDPQAYLVHVIVSCSLACAHRFPKAVTSGLDTEQQFFVRLLRRYLGNLACRLIRSRGGE